MNENNSKKYRVVITLKHSVNKNEIVLIEYGDTEEIVKENVLKKLGYNNEDSLTIQLFELEIEE